VARLLKYLLSICAFASFLFFSLLIATGCGRGSNASKEVAYVNAPQVVLRDRLATIYEKKGTVQSGEKVVVLDRQRRFVLVRSERGEEGWIAERYLIGADIFSQFDKLSTDNAKISAQSRGITRASLNLHLTPGRDSEHLFQLNEGEKVDILKRGTAEKPAHLQPVPSSVKKANKKGEDEDSGPALEDWSLVRNQEGRVGWVLARMMDIEIPLEIAQYAEGQRIVSSFVLNEVKDKDKLVRQYLVLLTDTKDGLPWDFNQIRVFSWNLKRHRYETAYRERNLVGVFPVEVGTEDFGTEGVLPVFTLTVNNDAGQQSKRKYRMIGPIVRRVATPEELKAEAAERVARKGHQQESRVAPPVRF
jgi:SH3-like domain-containing protein